MGFAGLAYVSRTNSDADGLTDQVFTLQEKRFQSGSSDDNIC